MWSFRAEGTPTQVEDATNKSRDQEKELGLAKQAELVRKSVLNSIDEMVDGQEIDCIIGVAAEITHRRGHEDEMEYRAEIIFKCVPVPPAQPQDHSQDQDQPHAQGNGKTVPPVKNDKPAPQPAKPRK